MEYFIQNYALDRFAILLGLSCLAIGFGILMIHPLYLFGYSKGWLYPNLVLFILLVLALGTPYYLFRANSDD